jgi:hypothetical protein
MNYYERYQNGEMVQVYDEIMALGDKAFEPSNLQEIEKVRRRILKDWKSAGRRRKSSNNSSLFKGCISYTRPA